MYSLATSKLTRRTTPDSSSPVIPAKTCSSAPSTSILIRSMRSKRPAWTSSGSAGTVISSQRVDAILGREQVLDGLQRPRHREPLRGDEPELALGRRRGLRDDLDAVVEPVHRDVVAQEVDDPRVGLVGDHAAVLPHLKAHQQREQTDVGANVEHRVARFDVALQIRRERQVVAALGHQLRHQRQIVAREQQPPTPGRADQDAAAADVAAMQTRRRVRRALPPAAARAPRPAARAVRAPWRAARRARARRARGV